MTESPEPAGLLPPHGESWEDAARYWYKSWLTMNELATGELLQHAEIRQALSDHIRRVESALLDLAQQADEQSVTPGMMSTNVIRSVLRPEPQSIDQEPHA